MRVRFATLGCRVNQVESQGLARLFEEQGDTVVSGGAADVVVVNSCTVTAEADRKTRQTVRRLRREYPSAVIVLTGCYPQASPEAAAALPEADLVTGTADRSGLPSLVREYFDGRPRRAAVEPHRAKETFETLDAPRFDARFQKAYLKVEDGCDRYCSYCIIPTARGRVRSGLPADVTRRAAELVKNGYREIVLTGINLSRYGAEWGGSLADAAEAVNAVEGDFRIRLGSVEPDLLTLRDWERLAACEKLCPHFHLALQSGCDATLSRMNRRYTTAQYRKTVETARRLFPAASVTTDLIVGFPGETREEFDTTCDFVRSLGLLRAHIFVYSPRPGTPAAAMPGRVDGQEARRRARVLADIAAESAAAWAETQLGRCVRVLAEADGTGSADDSLEVILPDGCTPGELFFMRLTGREKARCTGIRIE